MINSKDAKHFYFNGCKLWPCVVTGVVLNGDNEHIGYCVKTHFFKLPHFADLNSVFNRDDPNVEIKFNRSGCNVKLSINESEEND